VFRISAARRDPERNGPTAAKDARLAGLKSNAVWDLQAVVDANGEHCERAWHALHSPMPTLVRLAGGKIAMVAVDHGEPHFHIETAAGRCSVSIERLVVIVGSVKPTVLRQAIGWAQQNQALLRTRWKELNR
jgi:hypothetical protein